MYKVQEESNFTTLVDCLELGKAHYLEVEKERNDKVGFQINLPLFKILIDAELIHLIVARNSDEEIVGYFCTTVSPDLFCNQFTAKEIGIYVKPEYRKTRVFKLLMNKIEEVLRENGVAYNYVMFKKDHNENLPLKLGYTKTEVVYQKYLGE